MNSQWIVTEVRFESQERIRKQIGVVYKTDDGCILLINKFLSFLIVFRRPNVLLKRN